MKERLSDNDIINITEREEGFGVVLSWFADEPRYFSPFNQRIYSLLKHYNDTVPEDIIQRLNLATALIQDVWKMHSSDSEKLSIASREAIEGNPNATKAAIDLYDDPMIKGTEEQLLGVSHMVAALNEGVGEAYDPGEFRGKGRDHFSTGLIYLAKAMELKGKFYLETEKEIIRY